MKLKMDGKKKILVLIVGTILLLPQLAAAQCGMSVNKENLSYVRVSGNSVTCLTTGNGNIAGSISGYPRKFYSDQCQLSQMKQDLKNTRNRARRKILIRNLNKFESNIVSRKIACTGDNHINNTGDSPPGNISKPNNSRRSYCQAKAKLVTCTDISIDSFSFFVPDYNQSICMESEPFGTGEANTIEEAKYLAIQDCQKWVDFNYRLHDRVEEINSCEVTSCQSI